MDLTKGTGRSVGSIREHTSQLKRGQGPLSTFKPPAPFARHLSAYRNSTLHPNSPASSAEACVHNMNQLSIRDVTRSSQAQRGVPLAEPAQASPGQSQHGHFAFTLGISALVLCPLHYYSAAFHSCLLRVLLIPSCFPRHCSGLCFQADHAALLSILRNEGVSAAGLGSKPYNTLVSHFWFVLGILLTVFWPFFSMQCEKSSFCSLLLLLFAAPASFCP